MQVVGYIHCYLMQSITSHNFENSMVLHCTAQLCSKTKNSPLPPLENQRMRARLGMMALSPVIPIGHTTGGLLFVWIILLRDISVGLKIYSSWRSFIGEQPHRSFPAISQQKSSLTLKFHNNMMKLVSLLILKLSQRICRYLHVDNKTSIPSPFWL